MSATAVFSNEFVTDLISETVTAWSIAAAEVFFYGAYLVMFGFYLHVLRTHGTTQHRFLTLSTISLFVLGTAHFALELVITSFHTRLLLVTEDFPVSTDHADHAKIYVSLTYATTTVYVASNVIADGIFIFRCYAIWNFRRTIIILPTILTLCVAGFGCANLILAVPNSLELSMLFVTSVAISLFTTFVLMGLTIGRIWWLARAARHAMGRKVADRYYTICAMILESGALYFISGICFIVVGCIHPLSSSAILSGPIIGQVVGIAPTIIAVRVGLGCSVENVDSFIAAAPRARRPPQVVYATSSMDEQILHIWSDSVSSEAV
ncbi:hypothetical protein C8R44DRAFT_761080 [Mycena epipterygia]|nr:hypothetical protein C8R44DRAFT_761080 [Mycena epipterygia]